MTPARNRIVQNRGRIGQSAPPGCKTLRGRPQRGVESLPRVQADPQHRFPAGRNLCRAGQIPRLAAIGNDEIKKIVEANPQFYEGFIAGIPFNNVKASVEEIKRAKDMGAKGIQIYTHMNGEAIDTEKYWPIYEACEKYDLPILIHPVGGQMVPEFPKEDRSKYELWFTIGWPYQTTIAMINRAKVLLTKTDKSITQVAAECGYDDFTYFSRQFKKSTSLTPSAYRKTHADEDEEQKR